LAASKCRDLQGLDVDTAESIPIMVGVFSAPLVYECAVTLQAMNAGTLDAH